jgi:hypothetical protein
MFPLAVCIKSSHFSTFLSAVGFFVAVLGFVQSLEFARQVLYHLTHILCPLCFSYFLGRVSHFCPRPVSDHDSPTYDLLCSCYRFTPPQLTYSSRRNRTNFLPGLASNHNPPNFSLSSSLDYKHDP